MHKKVWEVDIDIIGPISISENISFKHEKGFDEDQFYSDIKLNNYQQGIYSTITAYADNSNIAETAAFVFIERMVNVLSFDNDIPLILSKHESITNHPFESATRRHLNKREFIAAFKIARKLELEHPIILKAIGWYSKGRSSINTLDKFLAYWNSIERIATKYHTKTERTSNGTINMVYQCFLDYFGETAVWGVPNRWINDMHEKRSYIAHGAEDTTAEAINDVAQLIPTLEEKSRKLIYAVLEKIEPNLFEEASLIAAFV